MDERNQHLVIDEETFKFSQLDMFMTQVSWFASLVKF